MSISTGRRLHNRRGFYEYGQQLLDVSVAAGQSGSVFFCDLDGLKTINDTYGHEIGDLAIKTEAKDLLKAAEKNLYEEKKIKHAKKC